LFAKTENSMKNYFIIFITTILIVRCNESRLQEVKLPERPEKVPQNAHWVGGVDGGNWYSISKVLANDTFELKIYNDFSGALDADTMFILNPDCTIRKIDSITLLKSISGYDGEKIWLNFPGKDSKCFLQQVKK
jgi:hypothetical protein